MIGQKLYFIVDIVEEYAGVELISWDESECEGIFIDVVLGEDYCFVYKVDFHCYDVVFLEIE